MGMSFFDGEMKPMLDVFLLETSQLLEQLDAILLEAEKRGSLTGEEINGIFRVMHTTKSSSAMMGLQDLSELAHKLEDSFDLFRGDAGKLQGVEEETFDLVFAVSDFVRDELKAMQSESYRPSKATELLIRIAVLHQKLNSGSQTIVRLRFEKDCKMENIRAFMAARQVRPLCSEIHLYPENVEKDPGTAEYIRQEGFYIRFLAENREQVMERLRNALFVEECQVVDEIPPREQAAAPGATAPAEPGSQFIRVRVDRLDELQNLMGELLVASAGVGVGGGGESPLPEGARHQLERLLDELEDIVISIRMVPFSGLLPKLNRIVRDICTKEKKEVSFVVDGQDVEVDKNIVDGIFEPMMHLLRNAIDHGIEPPEEREALGKKRAGQVEVRFACMGGEVVCTVSDDGRGIDMEQLRRRARQKGLLRRAEESYTEEELLELCFLPGFSTRETASEYSGRGVGLDVVRNMIERFGGHLRMESKKGEGTKVTMHLPLSLTLIDAVLFRVGKQSFALPAYQVDRFFSFSEESPFYREQNGRKLWLYEDRCRQIISLCDLYALARPADSPQQLLSIHGASRSACLLVDQIDGQRSVVAKPLPKLFGPHFKQRTGMTGSCVLGDGSICALLDAEHLIKAALEGYNT